MPLPIQSDIVKMDYPSRGLPFVDVPAKTGISTQTMDYPSRGLPFVTNDGFTAAGGGSSQVNWPIFNGQKFWSPRFS